MLRLKRRTVECAQQDRVIWAKKGIVLNNMPQKVSFRWKKIISPSKNRVFQPSHVFDQNADIQVKLYIASCSSRDSS